MQPDRKPAGSEPESEGGDKGQFWIMEKLGVKGSIGVYSLDEIEEVPSLQIVDGAFDTAEEAEEALKKGLASGDWSA